MSTEHQRERNSLIIRLFNSGKSQADIARQFKLASSRVSQIIATADRLEERRAALKKQYSKRPKIDALPDNAPVDVLVLCNTNFHGWSVRVTHLEYTSLKIKTLGDLRRITDVQLLREPSIGRRLVAQLRLFCPFVSEHRAEGGKKGK